MVIALLTDFGTRDYYVGAMKGVILAIDQRAVVVDITHDIPPQDVRAAAFVLRACYRDFPTGTIFLCVVDPGVGTDRRGMIAAAGGYHFVGPDNGLFSFILSADATVYEITNDLYFRTPVSPTFHGRDIFAPVAAHLSLGVSPEKFGPTIDLPVIISSATVSRTAGGRLEASVIYIDRFGNIVTNISAADAVQPIEIEMGGAVIRNRRETYAGAPTDEPFMIIGSAGLLEISIDSGSAADKLDAKVGDQIIARPATTR